MTRKLLLIAIVIVFNMCLNFAYGQQPITISGTVKNDAGNSLSGVTVKVLNSTNGTATNADGQYTIQVPDSSSSLEFTMINYQSQTLLIKGQTNFDVVLSASTGQLEDVVVIGYGTQKKANLTGAVATVTGAEMNKRIAANPTQLLQGQLPGLQVTQASGEAGSEGNVLRVRGLGTYSGAGNNPLVIVDGIPGSLTALNPESIESVTLLKDAASAAIYGSRAANGVILVTTKKGKAGKTQISYSYNFGRTSATRLPDFVYNSAQYMQLYNKAAMNSAITANNVRDHTSPTPPASLYTDAQIASYTNPTDKNLYPNFNWLDLIVRPVNVQTHNLNISGGSEKATYNIGLGFVNQPDVMLGFGYKKYNMQFNLNAKINDRINFGNSLTLNYGDRRLPSTGTVLVATPTITNPSIFGNTFNGSASQDQFLSTLSQAPLYGPVLPDGSGRYTQTVFMNGTAITNGPSPNKNPYAVAREAKARMNDYTLQGNIFLDIKVIEGLQWKTSLGTNFSYTKLYAYKPVISQYSWLAPANALQTRALDVGGQGLTVADESIVNPAGYSQLTYAKKIDKHNINALIGTQTDYYKIQSLSGFRQFYPNNEAQELNVGSPGTQLNNGAASEWSLNSYYGRLAYDYAGKYLIEGNARYDGSSRFRQGRKWGFFPSASVGYRISQEDFFEPLKSVISDLKFRASVGKLGNQNIGFYPYQNVYSTGFPYPELTSLPDGVRQTKLVDNNITWETTKQTNIGLDIAFLNNKLALTAEYYSRTTTDILGEANIPSYLGYDPPIINNGTIRNRGFEFNVSYRDKIGELGYSIIGTLQANKNKLLKFGPQQIAANTIIREGIPYNSFYVYQFEKIFQDSIEIKSSPTQQFGPLPPGTFKFKDINGDGQVNESDRTVVSGMYPNFDYSLNLSLDYKSFDLSIFAYGSQGQKQYVNGWGFQPFNQGSVPTTDWLNSWTPENKSTTMPLIYITGTGIVSSNISTVSTYYLRDASFLKIKNIQLGYNVPANWLKEFGISAFRVYFSGENLFIITKYPGLDPERVPNNTRFVVHPQNKVFNFGARITF